MNNFLSRLPETPKRSMFCHLGKPNQSLAASLGLIMMVCPCSELLAKNGLLTPVEERLVLEKTTKESSFLDDLINHNTYVGNIPTIALNTNATNLVFAMNHENEQGQRTDEHSEESEGAGAQIPRPLSTIPLPPMTHAEVSDIIRELNTGIDQETLDTLLNFVPVTPPDESLTIDGMLVKLMQTLRIPVDCHMITMHLVLSSIEGTTTPVDMGQPNQKQSLALLMLAYYTAINSEKLPHKMAYEFFLSFLLHACDLSGIEKLHTIKGDLLGTDKPTEDQDVLKENVRKSAIIFAGLRKQEEMRVYFFLKQIKNTSEAEESETKVQNPVLEKVSNLLNRGVNKIGLPLYERNIKSAKRMLKVLELTGFGKKKSQLVASNNLFINLIDAISMTLDPYVIQFAKTLIDNMSSYFTASNWDQTITDSEGKEQKLFQVFQKLITDAKENPGNENPELFQQLLLALEKYIEQQLQKTFTEKNDYEFIMVTLGTGFQALLEQSRKVLLMLDRSIDASANEQADGAKHGEAARGELSEEEKKRKHLGQRINYLQDFVDWFGSHYGFAVNSHYDTDSSDSDSSDSDSSDSDSSDSDSSDSQSNDIDRGSPEEMNPPVLSNQLLPANCWLEDVTV
ncbi:hypothetical protein [Endozoicomonas sp. ISHI1]|uniref:hypothetical protein n=2 Tax=unclassified Endozoicomonas TaxID=2644528 RepID=UPI0021489499|nr:hypothetical protein [Endozoicomonas sp. ISHI1]